MTTKLRAIKVEYYTTRTNGSARIRLSETSNVYKRQSICLEFDYEVGDILKQATSILKKKGFNIVAYTDNVKYYFILVDNFARDYISLK